MKKFRIIHNRQIKRKIIFNVKFYHIARKIVFKKYIIILLKLWILLVILYIYNRKQKISINANEFSFNDISFLNESIYEAARRAQFFIRNISDKILTTSIPLAHIYSPKVSVIIPIYNCNNSIVRAIRSVQNQYFSKFELILINDFSKDNTLDIIKDLEKKDKRIKIINNKKNMGILYSRSIGTLSAKGKYILPLDNDDMFLNNDVFKIIYHEIEINKVDILYFRGISVWHFSDFLNLRNLYHFRSFTEQTFLSQPELGDYAIKRSVLWTQCIKTKLYQKSINLLGMERYSKYVTIYEDAIINYINNQLAERAELFLKFGILHIDKPWSTSRIINQVNRNLYELYFIDTVFDFSRNTINDKKTAVNRIIDVIGRTSLKDTLNNTENKLFFKSLINKMISSEYISNENKQIIREKIFQNKLLINTNISFI